MFRYGCNDQVARALSNQTPLNTFHPKYEQELFQILRVSKRIAIDDLRISVKQKFS